MKPGLGHKSESMAKSMDTICDFHDPVSSKAKYPQDP